MPGPIIRAKATWRSHPPPQIHKKKRGNWPTAARVGKFHIPTLRISAGRWETAVLALTLEIFGILGFVFFNDSCDLLTCYSALCPINMQVLIGVAADPAAGIGDTTAILLPESLKLSLPFLETSCKKVAGCTTQRGSEENAKVLHLLLQLLKMLGVTHLESQKVGMNISPNVA